MKYLLVVVVVVAVLWVMFGRSSRRGDGARKAKRPAAGPVPMVACAHCGVNLPLDEAVVEGADRYCSEAHRLAGPAKR